MPVRCPNLVSSGGRDSYGEVAAAGGKVAGYREG